MSGTTRVDKWLWATRWFKTRGLARDAVQAGHVRVNGERAKPARQIKPGDKLQIVRGQHEFAIEILEIREKRVAASDARTAFSESEASRARREQLALVRQQHRARPDARTRRELRRIKHGES